MSHLRSEMLTLLLLLEFAGIRAVCKGESCMIQTVFMQSFTYTQARVLEFHVEKPGVIAISVREVLDGVPTAAERDRKLQELVAWTMYTDSDNRCSSPGVWGVVTKPTSTAHNDDTDGSDDPGHESDRNGCSATTSETADTSQSQVQIPQTPSNRNTTGIVNSTEYRKDIETVLKEEINRLNVL
ncbi:hypothetical protein FHL15_001084 [Xylaria flabelliformis]|uniref:Uncharacterized protein n=1 Tax=Xylaria flabelliformis TaxID=2512241 RepID=A0A553ICF3_9PEZI|nr:hypothetical protein FHL15_001084 [Xylaria flabelliformis]